jgi:hypothetical protein
MPSIVHTSVTFTTHSHVVKDEIVHDFTTHSAGLDKYGHGTLIDPLLELFYNDDVSHPLASYLSACIDRAVPVVIRHYALSEVSATDVSTLVGGGHGSPFATHSFDLGAVGAGQQMSTQTCVVLSWHAARAGTSEHSGHGPRTAQRTRGRLYFGPLMSLAVAIDPANFTAVVNGAMLDAMSRSATRWLNLDGLHGDYEPVVWSRVNNNVKKIVGGHVDNRFDTQRRRAEDATFRTLFGAPA